jgi:rhodanese-related sulfurtransferase
VPNRIETDAVGRLVDAGGQLVDVLPREEFLQEHIPGSINIPLAEIARATDVLDRDRPVIVYCYDHECDLSPRAAWRLEQLGFTEVYDYAASFTAWAGEGRPTEGLVSPRRRAGAVCHRDVPRVPADGRVDDVREVIGDWELAVVVNDHGVVLGTARAEVVDAPGDRAVVDVMQAAPRTVRPSITVTELADSMDHDAERTILVTTLGGVLLGLIRRDDLDALA